MKKNQGLTLMELTIVLAIMVIIAAIAVPVFLLTTDRARLRADIQSANVIQSARDLYILERNPPPTDIMRVGNANEIVARLIATEYLNARSQRPQTTGANWTVRDGLIALDLDNATTEIRALYAELAITPAPSP